MTPETSQFFDQSGFFWQKEQEQNEEQGLSDMKPAVAGGEMQNSFLEMEPGKEIHPKN